MLQSDTPAEEDSVEDIIETLTVDELQTLLTDLDEVMCLPEMAQFLTYLAVGLSPRADA